MAEWLLGYLAGVLCGRMLVLDSLRLLPSAYALILPALFLNLWLLQDKHKFKISIFAGICGFLWGVVFNAPSPPRNFANAHVIHSNFSAGDTTPLLVQAGSHIYETTGIGQVGAIGKIKVLPITGLFTPKKTKFHEEIPSAETTSSIWFTAIRNARGWIEKRLDESTNESWFKNWLSTIVLGDLSKIPSSLVHAFKNTGTIHLLVVSGSHVTFVATAILTMIWLPSRSLYGLRLIPSVHWPGLAIFLRITAVFGVLGFAAITGLCQAAQRAAIGFMVAEFARAMLGHIDLKRRLEISLFTQSLLFPIGLLCESVLMSWAAYLLVATPWLLNPDQSGAFLSRFLNRLKHALGLQLGVGLIMGVLCGRLALLGILLNPLIVPIFGWIFLTGVVATLIGDAQSQATLTIAQAHHWFIEVTLYFDGLARLYPWLVIPLGSTQPIITIAFFIVGVGLIFNCVQNLSIRPLAAEGTPGGSRGDSSYGRYYRKRQAGISGG